eukprot:15463098-Alexandrium_andersonii.AAC.1
MPPAAKTPALVLATALRCLLRLLLRGRHSCPEILQSTMPLVPDSEAHKAALRQEKKDRQQALQKTPSIKGNQETPSISSYFGPSAHPFAHQ